MTGRVAQPGEGVNFGEGQWDTAEKRGVKVVDRPIPADPLALIEDMPKEWRDAGIMDRWQREDSPSFVGPISDLNRQLSKHGLDEYVPIEEEEEEDQYSRGLNHHQAKPITLDGVTMTRKDWAEKLGIHPSTLDVRIKNHPLRIALTKPKRKTIHYSERPLAYDGVTKTWGEWAKGLGLTISAFRSRMRRHPDNMTKVMQPPKFSMRRAG